MNSKWFKSIFTDLNNNFTVYRYGNKVKLVRHMYYVVT